MGITRKEFLKGAALLPFSAGCSSVEAAKPPNVLVMVLDDLPFHMTGGMPALDAKVRALGTEFPLSYVASPVCDPSRATIMTGKYPHRHDVNINDHAARRYRVLGHDRDDLPFHLKGRGYRTGQFGRWLHGLEDMPSYVPASFDRWISTVMYSDPLRANVDGRMKIPKNPGGSPVGQHQETRWLTDRFFAFKAEAEAEDAPWFAFANITAPHGSYTPTQASWDAYKTVPPARRPNYDRDDPAKPASVRRPPLTNAEHAEHAADWRGKMAELLDVDNQIGRIADALDWENTYLVFSSDNGYALGEHRLKAKAEPYEECSRTPMIVRGPGVVAGVSPLLVGNQDVAPTVYELAGLHDLAADTDGRSLLGPLIGAPSEDWRASMLIEQPEDRVGGNTYPGWHALRTADRLYVERAGRPELYDMGADPYQLSNQASDSARGAETAALSRKLGAMREATGEDLRAAEAS